MMNRTEIESLVKSALVFFKHESWCSCMNSEMFRNPLSYFGISDLNIFVAKIVELFSIVDSNKVATLNSIAPSWTSPDNVVDSLLNLLRD